MEKKFYLRTSLIDEETPWGLFILATIVGIVMAFGAWGVLLSQF